MLHLPWRNESDLKNDEQTWEEIYNLHKLHDKVEKTSKLGQIERTNEEDENDSDEDDSEDEDDCLDEQLLSSRLGPKSDIPSINLGNREVDLNYNWQDAYKEYEQYGTLADFQNYIDKMKGETTDEEPAFHLPQVDLSSDQKKIIDLVREQIMLIKTQQQVSDKCVKRVIVQGKAGTL